MIPKERSVSESEVSINSKKMEVLDLGNFMQEMMQAQGDPAKLEELKKKMEIFQNMREE